MPKKSGHFFGGRLGVEGEKRAQNKKISEAETRAHKAMLDSREESKETIKGYKVNNVVKLADEDRLPPGKRRGLGRVIEINETEGYLLVQFYPRNRRETGIIKLKTDFVVFVRKI